MTLVLLCSLGSFVAGFGLGVVRRREIGGPVPTGPPPAPHIGGYFGPADATTGLRLFVADRTGVAS